MRRLAFALLLLAAGTPALAQDADPPPVPESFEIGLSTETISVGTSFGGARLVVFGALDNADQRILRQGRYDIVVALEGPRRDVVVREKERFFGLWVNQGSERFEGVPESYSLASTRPIRDIASPVALRQMGIGAENSLATTRSVFQPAPVPGDDEYGAALLRLKVRAGLFAESVGAIEFVSPTLFRASLALPPDLPVGRHVARAFLFREGTFVRERTEDLWVVKTGIENRISVFASSNGLAYGVLAVVVAVLTGWLGRIAFKRD